MKTGPGKRSALGVKTQPSDCLQAVVLTVVGRLEHGALWVRETVVPALWPGVASAVLVVVGMPAAGVGEVRGVVPEVNTSPLVIRGPGQSAVGQGYCELRMRTRQELPRGWRAGCGRASR